ncbi:hypothetical protein [Rothia endophytica]|uniref:hypothetical protein n=1 Tax=Rothia endophytica TaxID=1324766 RepID=UPI001F369883|nr:hypothetical protein [Rothia endophytica]
MSQKQTLTAQDYKHLLDPSKHTTATGDIVALCGYTWPEEPNELSTAEVLRQLGEMPTCEICSVIVHTLVSGGAHA